VQSGPDEHRHVKKNVTTIQVRYEQGCGEYVYVDNHDHNIASEAKHRVQQATGSAKIHAS
jgi:hypothetical protein